MIPLLRSFEFARSHLWSHSGGWLNVLPMVGSVFHIPSQTSDTGLPQLTVNQQSFSFLRLISTLLKPIIFQVYSPSSHHHQESTKVLSSCNSSVRAIAGWTTSTEIQAGSRTTITWDIVFSLCKCKWIEMDEHWPFLSFMSDLFGGKPSVPLSATALWTFR